MVDTLHVVDVDREPLGSGELHGKDLDTRDGALDLRGDLPRQLPFLVVIRCHPCSCHKKWARRPISQNCSKCGEGRIARQIRGAAKSSSRISIPNQPNTMVTGPSFTSSTAIFAPNTPAATGTPSA